MSQMLFVLHIGVLPLQALCNFVCAHSYLATTNLVLWSWMQVQKFWRGLQARRSYQQQRAAAVRLQATWKGLRARRAFQLQRAAAMRIQALWRGRQARTEVARQRAHVVAIQAIWRGRLVRTTVARQRAAAVTIQAIWRGRGFRTTVARQSAAAVIIQRCVTLAHMTGLTHVTCFGENSLTAVTCYVCYVIGLSSTVPGLCSCGEASRIPELGGL